MKNMIDVKRFMDKEWLAGFATVGNGNKPHVVPIFFTYNNGKVYVQTDRKSVKVSNPRKNPSVAVAVYRDNDAVIIRGKRRIIENKDEFVKRTQERIRKYQLKLDFQGRDSMRIPLFNFRIRCVIEIIGEKLYSGNNGQKFLSTNQV